NTTLTCDSDTRRGSDLLSQQDPCVFIAFPNCLPSPSLQVLHPRRRRAASVPRPLMTASGPTSGATRLRPWIQVESLRLRCVRGSLRPRPRSGGRRVSSRRLVATRFSWKTFVDDRLSFNETRPDASPRSPPQPLAFLPRFTAYRRVTLCPSSVWSAVNTGRHSAVS